MRHFLYAIWSWWRKLHSGPIIYVRPTGSQHIISKCSVLGYPDSIILMTPESELKGDIVIAKNRRALGRYLSQEVTKESRIDTEDRLYRMSGLELHSNITALYLTYISIKQRCEEIEKEAQKKASLWEKESEIYRETTARCERLEQALREIADWRKTLKMQLAIVTLVEDDLTAGLDVLSGIATRALREKANDR